MQNLSDYAPRQLPGDKTLIGRSVRLEPYDPTKHAAALAALFSDPKHEDTWRYMPRGPFDTPEAFLKGFDDWRAGGGEPWNEYVFLDPETGDMLGMASYMRQRPQHGSIEIGAVAFSHKLRRSTAATEAVYLMAAHIFDDFGYRRFEWKCHNENQRSKAAALRFGFLFEGIFRNDMVMKGKSRDTAWFAMTNEDWPLIRRSYELWLNPGNFDDKGVQKTSLVTFRKSLQLQQQQQQ